MDASLKYLSRIIHAEMEHAEHVLAFLLDKERVLIRNDAKAFQALTMEEQSLFVKSRELEANRKDVVSVILKKLGLGPGATLEDILARAAGGIKEEMVTIRTRFRELLLKIREQNRKCDLLLAKTIQMVNYSLGLLSGRVRPRQKMIYNRQLATRSTGSGHALLDQKG